MAHLLHSPCNWSDFKGFFWSFPISLNLDKRFPRIITTLIIPKINILCFLFYCVLECCLGVDYIDWFPPNDFPIIQVFVEILLPSFSTSSALARRRKVFCWAHKWSIIVREVEMRDNFSTKSWQKSGKIRSVMISVMRWEKLHWGISKLKVHCSQGN